MIIVASEHETENEQSLDESIEAARRLYCDVLGGREIAPAVPGSDLGALRFLVGGVLVETGIMRRRQSPGSMLPVRNPADVAARCWNAGYTVVVQEGKGTPSAPALAVIDPYGRSLELVRLSPAPRDDP